MQFKKWLSLLMVCTLLLSTLLLSACDLTEDLYLPSVPTQESESDSEIPTETGKEEPDEPPYMKDGLYLMEIQTVYEMAKEAGYTGTLEELIAMFKGEAGPAGADGVTPHIGENGNWWVGETDLGVYVQGPRGEQGEQGEVGPQGPAGADGLTPYIGENGNWWIGETDTGVLAITVGIENLEIDADGHLIVTLTDGTVNDLGQVATPSVGVKSIQIDEFGQLIINLSNGISVQSPPLNVTMEGYVNGMTITDAGEMIIHTSIGVNYNYGKIVLVYMNGDELMFRFDDGEELSLGTIKVIGYNHEHEYSEYELGLAPTCTSIGYEFRTCTVCGGIDYLFTEAHGHTFDEGFILEEAVGKEDGTALFSCIICKTVIMEKVPGIRFSEGLTYEMIADKEEYRVTGLGSCEDTEINIPEEHEGLPVTEIGEKAFYDCDHITSVTIPETVQKIADKAFSECDILKDVAMPDTVEIGTDVFRGSIYVELIISHKIIYVEAKDATCFEPGHIAHYYCETCDLCYEDEAATIRIYDVTIPSAHEFVDGVCVNCGMIQDSILIVAIDEIPYLGKFPLGTLEDAIGLPTMINAVTADGILHTLPIVWDLSTYNKSVAGEYTINGVVQAPEYRFAEDVSNIVYANCEITESMKGTADIVFILDISGSMGDEINNVKNNINKFAQAIEDKGVSARWSVITYSDYSDCPGDPREITQIIPNGASDWYISANECKSAINSISLANGGDGPEVAIDGLMMASTLTTRKDARTFYILLTDYTYKTANKHGVSSMSQATQILDDKGVNISVITTSSFMSDYSILTSTTGGIMSNIYNNFSQDLINGLVPIIYEEVIA